MDAFQAFVAGQRAVARETAVWGPPVGPTQLEVNIYLTGRLPPLDLVTSVRAVVRQGAQVLLVRNAEETHILPGGRREPGETLEQTVRREILEETGWEVGPLRQLGVKHFHHLTPRPAGYAYPYPDFLNVVYTAEAARHVPEARRVDDYELSAEFVPVTAALRAALPPSQQALLDAAWAAGGYAESD